MTFDAISAVSTLDTFAHTTSGSNRVLYLYVTCASAEQAGISATYGGDALTAVDFEDAGDATGLKTFYKIGPDVGANNVVITGSSGHRAIAVSYHGARQSTVPDTTHTDGAAATATSRTLAITSVSQSCWKIMCVYVSAGNATFTSGAGTTLRSSGAANQYLAVLDSNGPLPIGASNLVVSFANNLNVATGWAFAPTSVAASMLMVF